MFVFLAYLFPCPCNYCGTKPSEKLSFCLSKEAPEIKDLFMANNTKTSYHRYDPIPVAVLEDTVNSNKT